MFSFSQALMAVMKFASLIGSVTVEKGTNVLQPLRECFK
jgi:hypothetical protein